MTYWSFETPMAHLEDFAPWQDFHFALSFIKDSRYYTFLAREYFKGVKKIWLDNSVNETNKPDDPIKLAHLAQYVKADYIIAPDMCHWDYHTIYDKFCEVHYRSPIGCQTIFVAHTYEMSKRALSSSPRPAKIALSYETRQEFTETELYNCARGHAHFLGLNSVHEILKYKPLTVDTGMPIKLAMQGKTIREWDAEGSPHIHNRDFPDFFKMIMTEKEIKLAIHNIEELKRL
jgi:hypothetical protein